MSRIGGLLLLAALLLWCGFLGMPGSQAQDGASSAPGLEKASKGGAGRSDKKKKEAKARKETPGGVTVTWNGEVWGPARVKLQMYRQNKTGKWEPLNRLSLLAIASGDKGLKAYGNWYQALLAGLNGQKEEAIKRLQEAVDLGYKNVVAMDAAEAFQELRDLPEFKAIVEPLRAQLLLRREKLFRAQIDKALKQTTQAKPLFEGLSQDGKPFWTSGRPMIVVVTEVHHDGFLKMVPRLKRAQAQAGEGISLGVLFSQQVLDDPTRLEQTRDYVQELGISFSWTVIGRNLYREIDQFLVSRAKEMASAAVEPEGESEDDAGSLVKAPPTTFPLITLLLDDRGVALHGLLGVPEDWQLDYVLQRLKELAPKAPPKEEPKAEAKAEAPPPDPKPAPADPKKAEEKAEGKKPETKPEAPPPAEPQKPEGQKPEPQKIEPQKEAGYAEPDKKAPYLLGLLYSGFRRRGLTEAVSSLGKNSLQ